MSSERLWIVLLALTSLLAGLALGLLVSFSIDRRPSSEPSSFGAYEARMIETFALDAEGARVLRMALASYEEEVESLKARHVSELEPELAELGRTCRERIRTHVIPTPRLPEFDQLAAGTLSNPGTPR